MLSSLFWIGLKMRTFDDYSLATAVSFQPIEFYLISFSFSNIQWKIVEYKNILYNYSFLDSR